MNPNNSPLENFLFNLATCGFVLLAATVVGIGLSELIIRLFFPVYDPSGQVYFYTNESGIILGPAGKKTRQSKNTGDYDVTVQFNEYGLRDRKDVADAKADDIVVVGDSFTFGWGVELQDRFSDLLQASTGRRVFNLAIPGSNLEHYRKLIGYAQSHGSKAASIVVAVCMENDLGIYKASYGFSEVEGNKSAQIPEHEIQLSVSDVKYWLSHYSAIYKLLTTAIHQSPMLKTLAVQAGAVIPNLEGIQGNVHSIPAIQSSADKIANIVYPFEKAVILIIPSRGLWVGDNSYVEKKVHLEFISALLDRGLEVVDLKDNFSASNEPLSYHFENDAHWNEKGHRVAARALAAAFVE